MRRTTILAEDDLFLEAKHQAQHEGKTFSALVQDALRAYLEVHRPPRRISFAGMVRSGNPLTVQQIDELLRAGADRYEGWSPPRGGRSTDGVADQNGRG